MENPPITLTGRSITDAGITFIPGNGAPGFDEARTPEVVMWNDTDEVQVVVGNDAVYVTTETADTVGHFVSTVTRTTTAYRCPVRVVSYRVDFTLPAPDTDVYRPSLGVIDYGMFSDEGNVAVHAAVHAAINADNLTTPDEVCDTVEGHPEVTDTVVREAIYVALNDAGLIRQEG